MTATVRYDVATLVPTAPSDGLTVQIAAKESIADDVCMLTLREPSGRMLPDWTPGSHIDVMLGNGLVRQYSLCGDRGDPFHYRVAVLRERDGRGGSAYIHDELAVGHVLSMGGPRNNFAMVPADRYVFIAGGIGITPLLPMIAQAQQLNANWSLLYGGRTARSMAFTSRLTALGGRVTVWPEDQHGLLDLDSVLTATTADTRVYCCGPAALLAAVENCCSGWRPGRLRTERFVPAEVSAPIRTASFDVQLQRSGLTVTVDPGTTVLDAIMAAGVPMLSSCRQGTCGTCETGVIDGVPDHRDSLLGDDERQRNDCMFPCVSRSRSDRLVLDL